MYVNSFSKTEEGQEISVFHYEKTFKNNDVTRNDSIALSLETNRKKKRFETRFRSLERYEF